MPNRNGTGPRGCGPQTGRGLGPCGSGMGRGYGRGFGFRCNRSVALTEAEEKKMLEAELKEIEAEKQAIEQRLKEIK